MRAMKKVATLALVCTMMATATGAPVSAATKINVKKVSVASSLSGNSKTVYVAKGKTVALKSTVTVTPNKSANKGVTYKSSNKKIATVNNKGIVKGVKTGTAKITVTSKKNKKKKATITVQVKAAAVSNITFDKTETALKVGEKVTLKANVKAGKKACTDLVWSTSDKKVVTVTKKGVVKAVAAGTATITAKAIDGSGKKATCKVTVTDANSITAMDVLNAQTVTFTLSKAQQLTADQIAIKTKQIASGEYKKALKIDSVTSTDGVNYNVTVNANTVINLKDYVQITIAGIEKPMEKQYVEEVCAFTGDSVVPWTVGAYSDRTFVFSEVYGYSEYAITNLPAGLTSEIEGNKIHVKGTPTAAGVSTAVLTAKDEKGNTLTRNIVFAIGSDSVIAAAAATEYSLVSEETNIGITGYATGGSGQYNYEIVADSQNTGAKISPNGKQFRITAKIQKAGDYTVRVKVTDANDANKSCETDVVMHIAQGVSISGIAKDAQGNAIPNVEVAFDNKNRADRYLTYKVVTSDSETGAYSAILSPGEYDIVATRDTESEAGCAKTYLNRQSLKADNKEFHVTLPLYRIQMTTTDSDATTYMEHMKWYWNDEKVGEGKEIFVKPGSYTFETGEFTLDGERVTKIEGDWFNGYKKTDTIPGSLNKLTCVANVDNSGLLATVVKTMVKDTTQVNTMEWLPGKDTPFCVTELEKNYYMTELTDYKNGNTYSAYKFVPEEDGNYEIRRAKLALYDAEGKKLQDTNGAYELKQGETYYIADENGDVLNSCSSVFNVAKVK